MQVAKAEKTFETKMRQFCTFRICGRLYGVDILDVREVNPEKDFTPIYHAPKEIKGYINIRGQIYLLIDLRLILGFEKKEVDDASRIVLFKSEVGESFGALVDSIEDITAIDEKQIENRRKRNQELPEDAERRGIDIADGVCKMEKELLVVINARNVLNLIGKLKSQSI